MRTNGIMDYARLHHYVALIYARGVPCHEWRATANLHIPKRFALTLHMRVQGLVVPPRVAVTQAVVVPIPNAKLSAEQHTAISAKAAEIYGALVAAGVRTHLDDRDNYTPGWKYNHWELKARHRLLPQNPKP